VARPLNATPAMAPRKSGSSRMPAASDDVSTSAAYRPMLEVVVARRAAPQDPALTGKTGANGAFLKNHITKNSEFLQAFSVLERA
jgi:hypothetical protein